MHYSATRVSVRQLDISESLGRHVVMPLDYELDTISHCSDIGLDGVVWGYGFVPYIGAY